MTVKELRELIADIPDDTPIFKWDEDFCYIPVSSAIYSEEEVTYKGQAWVKMMILGIQ